MSAQVETAAAAPAAAPPRQQQQPHQQQETLEVSPYAHQVGGHSKAAGDGAPASLLDEHGRFLKKLQAGERGQREAAFYRAMEQHHAEWQQQQQQQQGAGAAAAADPHAAALLQLAAWLPRSYGVRELGGADYLVLQDVAGGYRQPCVLDIKIGFRTWYAWASDALKDKYRSKDAATTQASLGFRLCGLLVHNAVSGSVSREDRHWGKALAPADVGRELQRFADNGHLCLADLLPGPRGLLAQLSALAAVFEAQRAWHFYSSSLLLVYEGAARSAAEARLAVRLIDFAHAFPCAPPPAAGEAQDAPCGADTNFLAGLRSLMRVLRELLPGQGQ